MPRIGYHLLGVLLAVVLGAGGEPPAPLQRGVNITHWFRYPPSRDPAVLSAYLSDDELRQLRRIGFDFIRLPVQPDLLDSSDAVAAVVARARRQGLATVVALFAAADWHLEADPNDRARFLDAWRMLARALRRTDPRSTFPEVLNEPVFAGDPAAWTSLQHQAVSAIRTSLPRNTIVVTGAAWGGIDGLLSQPPEGDANVLYSFHFYEPAELTSLAAYRPGLDTAALARLPFPAADEASCGEAAQDTDAPTAELIRFYCAQGWDGSKLAGRIDAAAGWARSHHVHVIGGEFGASGRLNAAARFAWIATVREACERHDIGWALWGYDDVMGFGLGATNRHVATRDGIDPALLRALGLNTAQ